MPKILIVGGGYAGFYTAKKLEKYLGKSEAEVTLVDPLPYMTYQPFLPEVAAGSIEPRHVLVSYRRHLKRTNIVGGKVSYINHQDKKVTVSSPNLETYELEYDQIVVTAGAVSRTFPIPGIADLAIGMKTIEEAIEVRDRLFTNFDRAAGLPAGPERQKLLTFVVVGGGFAGIEAFAEMLSLATYLLRYYPNIKFEEVQFHLVEAMSRVMPEVSLKTSEWVVKNLRDRNAHVHLDTQLQSAENGLVELSSGLKLSAETIVWTAGVMANPAVKNTDLPLDERGRVTADSSLRIVEGENIIDGAWTAGDNSAVPDLSGDGVGGYCVPNAQHAVRQGKLLAKNLVASLRGEGIKPYFHKNMGAVAGLGIGVGVFQYRKIAVTGLLAWFMHRGYHVLAMPMWERKFRVLGGWIANFLLRRDVVSIESTKDPRLAFETWASRPKN
jgi:NADH dehydrogenase